MGTGSTSKFNISVEKTLAKSIREAAEREADGNVSAWFAKVAEDGLRRRGLRELLAADEEKYGPVPQEALDEIERKWPAG